MRAELQIYAVVTQDSLSFGCIFEEARAALFVRQSGKNKEKPMSNQAERSRCRNGSELRSIVLKAPYIKSEQNANMDQLKHVLAVLNLPMVGISLELFFKQPRETHEDSPFTV